MNVDEESAATASAVEKALMVLEAALTNPRFTDVVQATGLAKSTVHRITSTLAEYGFVEIDSSGRYLPGAKMLQLAGRALERIDISALASPYIDELIAQTQCTIHVAALNGDEAIYVARKDSDKPYRMPSRVGKSIWLHSTGIGKALLASMTDDEVNSLIARTGLPTRTPNTLTEANALRAEIELIRDRGYSLDDEENEPGIRCVAVAIRDHTGNSVYGISAATLSLEKSVSQLRSIAPLVINAAQQISIALGYDPRTRSQALTAS